jgi:hypothetical protein
VQLISFPLEAGLQRAQSIVLKMHTHLATSGVGVLDAAATIICFSLQHKAVVLQQARCSQFKLNHVIGATNIPGSCCQPLHMQIPCAAAVLNLLHARICIVTVTATQALANLRLLVWVGSYQRTLTCMRL